MVVLRWVPNSPSLADDIAPTHGHKLDVEYRGQHLTDPSAKTLLSATAAPSSGDPNAANAPPTFI